MTPQPVLAVLPMLDEPPAGRPGRPVRASLIVVLVDVRDPGQRRHRAAGRGRLGRRARWSSPATRSTPTTPRRCAPRPARSSTSPSAVRRRPAALAAELARRGLPHPGHRRARRRGLRRRSTGRSRRRCSWATSPRGSTRRSDGALGGAAGHPDGGAGRVAQRGRGLRRGLLRGVPPTPGRRCRRHVASRTADRPTVTGDGLDMVTDNVDLDIDGITGDGRAGHRGRGVDRRPGAGRDRAPGQALRADPGPPRPGRPRPRGPQGGRPPAQRGAGQARGAAGRPAGPSWPRPSEPRPSRPTAST